MNFFIAMLWAFSGRTTDCFLVGSVYLRFENDDHIVGTVGEQEISLGRYYDFVYGDIKGAETRLVIEHSTNGDRLRGRVGNYHVDWKINTARNMVLDYQPCVNEGEVLP
jgi:hypothetical protein